MKSRLISILILILFLATKTAIAAIPVSVVQPEIREISKFKTINSVIEPYQDLQLAAVNGGIVEKVKVQIGDYVKAGQPLLVFEQDNLQNQLMQAEAAVEIAEANLLKLKKGATEEQITAAEAGVKQAEAALEIARANYQMLKSGATSEDRASVEAAYQQALASYEGARTSLELLETIYRDRTALKQQLLSAETQLKSAEKQVKLAEENLEQALTGLAQAEKEFERTKYLHQEGVVTGSQYELVENQYENARSVVESARIAKEQALISYQAAKEGYELARENYTNPTQLEQQLAAARTQLAVAEANEKMARANLDKLEKGAREEDLIIAQANLEQAEAALERARAQLQELKKGVSKEDIAIGEANLKQAKASLEQVKKALADTIITSPIDGQVSQLNYEAGEMVGPGTPVISIVNLEKVYITAEVTEGLINNLEKGQRVQARLLAADNQYLEGIIEYISPVANPATQAFTVKVLAANSEGKLRGGMFAELYLPLTEKREALVLPVSALIDLGKAPYVYVVDNGRVIKNPVETGIIFNNYVEIISGLNEKQLVVSKGQHNLREGSLVEVIE